MRVGERPLICEGVPTLLRRGHLLLQTLSVPLVCQHLLLLECLLSKANFYFDDRTFVDDASARLAFINEKLLASNLDCLSFLKVAHVATKEVRLQDLEPD